VIRAARPEDLAALQDVERAAGTPFRDVGMDMIADDDPPSVEELATYQESGRAWVFTDEQDRPVAYLLVQAVDGYAHVEQVSVRPEFARRGIGRQLIDVAEKWAASSGLRGLTLTTYAEVPWNAPYYERLGFRVIADDDLTSGLRHIRDDEKAKGLDAWPRVTMRRASNEARSR
jgi:ribosomal protein S18 acetylase RimI-like enzyme